MREIKFRAWYNNKMWFVSSIRFDEGRIYLSETKDLLPDTYLKINDKELKLMQYTGFKDKNGKEIYEGDILEDKNFSSWCWYGVVQWFDSDGQYRLVDMLNSSKVSYPLRIGIEYKEVIGNVYENPDKVPSLFEDRNKDER